MGITRAVTFIGVFAGSRVEFHLTGAGYKQEVAQIGDTRSAQMRQAETEDGSMVVFIAGCRIVIFRVCIRTDLDTAERNLCTGVDIPVTVCSNQRSDVICQFLTPGCSGQNKTGNSE